MNNQKQLFGHPVGLYVLFFAEMWERFSFYGMRALFVLYLTARTTAQNPGLGWSNTEALKLFGIYTFLVYLSSIPGGIIADRWIGQKKTVILGGILLVIGHSVLAIDASWAFYTGIGFIIAGVGCLKPNISSMVGGLYAPGDARRDKGFTIFYIGINSGALLAGILVGSVAQAYGWHYGFGLAGIGMAIGLITFLFGQKYLRSVGELTSQRASSSLTVLAKKELSPIERDRMVVLLISFLMIVVFWAAFEQAGGLMNLYAEQKTNLTIASFNNFEVPAAWFQSVNSLFIILLGIPVATLWAFWKKSGRESSSIFKMAVGIIISGAGFIFMGLAADQFAEDGQSAMYWLILTYMFNTIGELSVSPVALSYVTKLAPLKYSSLMMGVYFAATGLGNYVASWIGVWAQTAGELKIFWGIVIFCAVFGLLVISLLKPLKRLAHNAEDMTEEEHTAMLNTQEIEVNKAL